jgi:hypothetical protein
MGNPLYYIAEGFRQIIQGAGSAVDRLFSSHTREVDTPISEVKAGPLKVTTSFNVANTTTIGTGFGDMLKMNSQNKPQSGPIIKVTNTTEASYQTKVELSGNVRGADVKLTNKTNVSTKKVTTTTELSVGKTASSTSGKTTVGAAAFIAVKATSSNGQNTSQTTTGVKASVSYSTGKATITNTFKVGVITSQ